MAKLTVVQYLTGYQKPIERHCNKQHCNRGGGGGGRCNRGGGGGGVVTGVEVAVGVVTGVEVAVGMLKMFNIGTHFTIFSI